MTPAPAPLSASGAQTRAILLMIGAILCFSLMDACAKALSQRIGVWPTLWTRYVGQAGLVLLIVAPRLHRVVRTRYPGLQALRSLFLFLATMCFFNGLARIDLAEATAVMNLNPVLITLGAGLILGERLGPRRLAGVGAALIGALIVIRPGSDVFSPFALFPLGAAVFYSAYALTTRFVGRDEDTWTSLVYAALFGSVVLTAVVPFHWQPVDGTSALLMAAIACLATGGQLLLITSLQRGEASLVAPFAYSGLIFAAILGLVFFGELPDLWTVLGATIIAVSGLYVWQRETRLARAAEARQ